MVDTIASLRRDRGYTQVFVADRLNIGRQMLMRMEQGLYTDLPHSAQLGRIYDVTEDEILRLYKEHVARTRERFSLKYPSFRDVLSGYSGAIMPLTYYRNHLQLTQIGFCKGLCVHPDPIRDYELNQQRGIPAQLIIACNAISWDYGALESAVVEWRVEGRADARK